MRQEIRVGDRVRTVRSAFVSRRESVVSRIATNSLGTVCYWLADGGVFSAAELELIPSLSDRWRKVYGLPKAVSV